MSLGGRVTFQLSIPKLLLSKASFFQDSVQVHRVVEVLNSDKLWFFCSKTKYSIF